MELKLVLEILNITNLQMSIYNSSGTNSSPQQKSAAETGVCACLISVFSNKHRRVESLSKNCVNMVYISLFYQAMSIFVMYIKNLTLTGKSAT
jgi:hypothetical protein